MNEITWALGGILMILGAVAFGLNPNSWILAIICILGMILLMLFSRRI